MLKYLVCVVFLVAAVSAYDFKDVDFNEYLWNEFEAERELFTSSRTRRDAKIEEEPATKTKRSSRHRDWRKEFTCCNDTHKFNRERSEGYYRDKKLCIAEVRGNDDDDSYDPFNCDQMQKIKQQMICVSECLAKKRKTLNANGELDRSALLDQLRSRVDHVPWKKDNVEAYVDKCLSAVQEQKMKNVSNYHSHCNPAPMEFQHCLWREFSNGCPAYLRIDSARCNKMRERLANGDTSSYNKNFLHHYFHRSTHNKGRKH